MVGRSNHVSRVVALVLMLLATSIAQAQVTARVDRNRLVEGETLTLVLQTNNTQQSLEVDLSVLETAFMVLDQRSETQMSIVNGQQSAVIRKMVTLEPLRPGRLVIPELNVGGARTQSIVVQVDPAPQAAPGEPDPVFIEVALNPEQGPYYVHAQVGLVVRLFYQQSLTEAAISQPEPDNASVRLLDEVPFQADRAGQRYRVLERRYALFPERSGEMTIPPLVLSGRLVERNPDQLWRPSSRGRRVTVESEPIRIEILPRPVNFSGDAWQPARSYELAEQLSTNGSVRVGEPITRTVTIDVVGLEENMIAEPAWPDIPDARIYPDQPQGISRDDGEWVLGHKEFRYAVVPEKDGELVLPEIAVRWWDTVANRERTAVLPARTIPVLPSEFAVSAPPVVEAAGSSAAADYSMAAPNGEGSAAEYWRWLTLVFAALWLATLAWALTSRGARSRPAAAGKGGASTPMEAEFRRACKANDPAAARQALRILIRREQRIPRRARHSLVDFCRLCDDETLAAAVRELNATGFSAEGDKGWDGKTLFRAWQAWLGDLDKARADEPPVIDLWAKKNRIGAGYR